MNFLDKIEEKQDRMKRIEEYEIKLTEALKKAGVWRVRIDAIPDRKNRAFAAADDCRAGGAIMLMEHLNDRLRVAEDEAREAMKAGKITIWDMEGIVSLGVKYQVLVRREVVKRLENKCGCKFKWPEFYPREMP